MEAFRLEHFHFQAIYTLKDTASNTAMAPSRVLLIYAAVAVALLCSVSADTPGLQFKFANRADTLKLNLADVRANSQQQHVPLAELARRLEQDPTMVRRAF